MRIARDCPCCGEAPGMGRTIQRRTAKRGERNKFRQAIRRYMSR